ncbi:hypothetical protein [Hymenobacter sp. B81]|uniref:hypothetical protein n=1 Tax=Hymenobacter sp. B81 TaxID=3344878 RepID=UPI0037DD329E
MDIGWLLLILFVFGTGALCLALPLLVLQAVRKWLKQRGHQRSAWTVGSGQILYSLGCLWLLKEVIFPSPASFESEFEQIVGRPLPQSGVVTDGKESGFDPHGDYISCLRVELSAAEFEALSRALAADSSYRRAAGGPDSTFIGSSEYQAVTANLPDSAYQIHYSKGIVNENVYRFIGFLRNRKTVIVYRVSS